MGPPQHLGWLGRLNGPVDNPRSACLSCHATAPVPPVSAMVPPFSPGDEGKMRWFRNVRAEEPFDPGAVALDHSLRVAFGIHNLAEARAVEAEPVAARSAAPRAGALAEADVTAIIDRAPDGRAIYRVTPGEQRRRCWCSQARLRTLQPAPGYNLAPTRVAPVMRGLGAGTGSRTRGGIPRSTLWRGRNACTTPTSASSCG